MAGAAELFTKVKAYIPAGWDWDTGTPNVWINKFCSGFVAMWTNGETGTGIPPWSTGSPWPHAHAVVTLEGSDLSDELETLGYTTAADTFFGAFSGAIADYLKTNTVVAEAADGLTSHDHTIGLLGLQRPFSFFGSGSGLKSDMLDAVPTFTGSGVDPIMNAFANGVIDFLTDYASLVAATGTSHKHTLGLDSTPPP